MSTKLVSRSFKYAIFPTREQAATIRHTCWCARRLYNHYVELRAYAFDVERGFSRVARRNKKGRRLTDANGKPIFDEVPVTPRPKLDEELALFPRTDTGKIKWGSKSKDDTGRSVSKAVTWYLRHDLVPDNPDDPEGPAHNPYLTADMQAMRYAYDNVDKAYQNFFRRCKQGGAPGYPKFKSARDAIQSYATLSGKQPIIDMAKGTIHSLPKLGTIAFDAHREPLGHIQRATVSMRSDNTFYISFGCSNSPVEMKPMGTEELGINRGCVSLVTTSDGTHYVNPRAYQNLYKKRARLQRRLDRKRGGGHSKKPSKGWYEARAQLSALDAHIANVRKYESHAVANDLINRCHTIHVDKFDIRKMIQDATDTHLHERKLSRDIADAGMGQFLELLTYKCDWHERLLLTSDLGDAITQTCCKCGHRQKVDLTRTRTFKCEVCDNEIDVDENAAINVLNGLAEPEPENAAAPDDKPKAPVKTTRKTTKKKTA